MYLVLLVLDVEVVEDFLLLCLSDAGVAVLAVEFPLPDFNFVVLLLNQLDQVLILIHEMSVLRQQQLDLLLQIIDFLALPDLEQQLLVYSHQFRLQLTHPATPIILVRVRVAVRIA